MDKLRGVVKELFVGEGILGVGILDLEMSKERRDHRGDQRRRRSQSSLVDLA